MFHNNVKMSALLSQQATDPIQIAYDTKLYWCLTTVINLAVKSRPWPFKRRQNKDIWEMEWPYYLPLLELLASSSASQVQMLNLQ